MALKQKIISKAPIWGPAVAGLGVGGLTYLSDRKSKRKDRLAGALGTGLYAAGIGYTLAHALKSDKRYSYRYGGRPGGSAGYYSRTKPRHPEAGNLSSVLNKVKTKADAKKAYRQSSIKTHPDKPGGSNEAFKDVNNEWKEFMSSGQFDKLAFLKFIHKRSAINEFEKLSMEKIAFGQRAAFEAMYNRLLSSRVKPEILQHPSGQDIYKKIISSVSKAKDKFAGG